MAGDAAQQPLVDQLRRASKKSHTISDGLVNARLLALFVDRDLFGRAISLFYFVFATLEAELTRALEGDPGERGLRMHDCMPACRAARARR